MKKYFKKNLLSFISTLSASSKGFTLIELLVVIGILGILSSALVATIDPFEQLKKASDANVKNVAVEFTNASIRYYTTHNAMPWDTANTSLATNQTICTSVFADMDASSYALTNAAMTACLDALISEGELKAGYTTVTDVLKRIYISSGGSDPVTNAVACFQPQSKSQAKDLNCKYGSQGTADSATFTGHDPTDTSTLCYWCAL